MRLYGIKTFFAFASLSLNTKTACLEYNEAIRNKNFIFKCYDYFVGSDGKLPHHPLVCSLASLGMHA